MTGVAHPRAVWGWPETGSLSLGVSLSFSLPSPIPPTEHRAEHRRSSRFILLRVVYPPFFFISMENLRNRMLPREPASGRGRHWHLIQEPISYCQWLRAHDPLVTSRGPATASTKGKGEGAEEGDGMGAGRGRGREAAKRDQGIGSLLWARAAAHSAAFGRGLRRLLLSARTLKQFSSSRRVRLVPRCEAC